MKLAVRSKFKIFFTKSSSSSSDSSSCCPVHFVNLLNFLAASILLWLRDIVSWPSIVIKDVYQRSHFSDVWNPVGNFYYNYIKMFFLSQLAGNMFLLYHNWIIVAFHHLHFHFIPKMASSSNCMLIKDFLC